MTYEPDQDTPTHHVSEHDAPLLACDGDKAIIRAQCDAQDQIFVRPDPSHLAPGG
jgi:hypothetical protein